MSARSGAEVILYFGNDWFAENRTSSHHVAERLADRCRVYYFECPGLRAPRADRRDLRKLIAKIIACLRRPRRITPSLHVATLIQLPWFRFRWARALNALCTRGLVRWTMWRERIEAPIVWCTVPHVPQVMKGLGQSVSVYYCIDDYSALPGVDPEAVAAMDAEMTRRADVVFVASETLLDGKKRLNPNTHLSPHGVDAEHFAAATRSPLPCPPELRDLARPVIGFFGLIETWIDLDLVRFLAERRPSWSFLMIGRIAVPHVDLPPQANIHFIGARPYAALPAYGQHFTAAIIPYRQTRQVFHSCSLKLREYLAMGASIVSTPTPQIEQYADVVDIARSPEEFLERLDRIVGTAAAPADTRRRIDRIAGDTWGSRVDRALRVVGQSMPHPVMELEARVVR